MSVIESQTEFAVNGRRLSYKFQRLREELRNAIVGGELRGRLPGERDLGRRFGANPKTINKALTDLAAEGLVTRQIGRGTFVIGSGEEKNAVAARRQFAVLSNASDPESPGARLSAAVIALLERQGHTCPGVPFASTTPQNGGSPADLFRQVSLPDAILCVPPRPLSRPAAGRPGEDLLQEILRRQINIVFAGDDCRTLRRNAVMPDYAEGGFQAAEFLARLGCRALLVLCASDPGPAVDAVVAGARTSATRRGLWWGKDHLGPTGSIEGSVRSPDRAATGCIAVGGMAVEALESMARGASSNQPCIGCAAVLEPGDACAEQLGLTAVEFDVDRLASWAARLTVETRFSQPASRVLIPGTLHIRNGLCAPPRSALAVAPTAAEAVF